jgi:hypothetical protein
LLIPDHFINDTRQSAARDLPARRLADLRTAPPTMPNFFIVGAARCGTTSLFEALARHPDVFCCPVKEPNYFAFDFIRRPDVLARARQQGCLIDQNFTYMLTPPRVAYTVDAAAYGKLFQGWRGETAIGEASTTYLPSRTAPRAIAAAQPDARIIVLLRNPIARALSDYRMHTQNGFSLETFAEFIAREKDKIDDPGSRGVLSSSLYATQIQRYLDCFPREQILFLLFDDLVRSPSESLRKVFHHLGVDPRIGRHIRIGWANKSRQPRFGRFNQAVLRSGKRGLLVSAIPKPVRVVLRHLYYTAGQGPAITPADQQSLLALYRDDIKETARLTGRNLDPWTKSGRLPPFA